MEEKVLTCFHCGNKTSMKQVAKHKNVEEEGLYDNFGLQIDCLTFTKTWYVYLCPVCAEITIKRTSWFSEDINYDGSPIIYEDIVFPTPQTNEQYIPKGVKDAFDAALRIRNMDGAICVLALRRALEKMCKDKGAKGKDLFHKLKDLQAQNILPEIINDVSSILRKEGNSAAHADDVEFDTETVNLMIEFTRTILDYVYTLPEKIKKAQERIKKHEVEMEKKQKEPSTG